jgi:hypothetical protein
MAVVRSLWLCSTLAGLVIGQSAAHAALEPHRAYYRLSLANSHRMSGLSDVQGALVIEWQLACDGWLSNQRMRFVALTETGGDYSHDSRFSSWESIDGQQLRYTARSFDGDALREEFRGEATLNGDQGGTATFTTPDSREVPLPPGTLFPTEHIERLLAEADNGPHFVSHEVFDGWGFDALMQVASVIGKPQDAASTDDEASPPEGDAWPVSMAYYNLEQTSDLPEFEANFVLTEQGVLRGLLLDYGDFRLKAALEDVEILDRPSC